MKALTIWLVGIDKLYWFGGLFCAYFGSKQREFIVKVQALPNAE